MKIPLLMLALRLLPTILKLIRLLAKLFFDKRVSKIVKLIVIACIAYILAPYDLTPDVIPYVGRIDDLIALVIAIFVLIKFSPQYVIDEILNLPKKNSRPEELDPDNVVDGKGNIND
ncbi:MAG TPA: hypothetical protein DEZ08_04335 [Dehalococcoidia bacterium]|jgi:uncharacterized membrane protein YkvA (DUF1232 family)|nr:hypothetical protein [Dehalococcoidia bacterium]|tara:strand:- start:409 stop:759 length:351 start_codon:yes stop_codon:yes gene_type:complete